MGNFEDDDFCARLEFLGYRLLVARGVFVYHKGSATFRDNDVDHGAWMTRNALRRSEKLSALPSAHRCRPGDDRATESHSCQLFQDQEPSRHVAARAQQPRESDARLIRGSARQQRRLGCRRRRRLRAVPAICAVTPAPGLGLGDLLNSGVDAAKGRFVTYLDDDDVVYPFHLAALVDAIGAEHPGERFVYSHYSLSFVVRRDAGPPKVVEQRRLPLWDYSREDLLVRNAPALHTWLHSRSLVDRVGGFDATLPVLEDWEFLLRATREIDLISHPRETCEYRLSLDFSSAIARRETALTALRDIYSRYPASSAKTERDRRAELDAQESQVARVASVIRRHAAGEIVTPAAVRELAMCIFSVALPASFKLDSEVERRWTPTSGRAGPAG